MRKKILVIRFSSIGDIILTTPVLRTLQLQIEAEVHFLTKPAFASILSSNPYLTKIITLQDDFENMIRLLREEKYDHIIDLHNNLRTRRIRMALDHSFSSFRKLNFEKWLMVNFKVNRLSQKHIVERYMDAVKFLDVQNDHSGLDFIIPDGEKINVVEKFNFQPGSYASIIIGATYFTKCLTADQIAELCGLLKMPVILLGGKDEVEKANAILQKTNNAQIKSACGILNIFGSSSILEQSATIISHDTGLMHIAAALKKPQIIIWGNTIPQFGMYPYYGNRDVKWAGFEQIGLPCRPCTKLGYNKCPKGHFKCIHDHDLQQITLAAKNLIA